MWQVPASQRVYDSDIGGSPGIWTVSGTEMIGACNKNGIFYAMKADRLSRGPVWQDQIGNPVTVGLGPVRRRPKYDGSSLYLSSNGTTISGTAYDGSIRKVNPATGAYIWQTGVAGQIIGSPQHRRRGVVAAASFGSKTGQNGVFLLNSAPAS
jgi:outer membrane protein assembly factor BamB